MNKKVYILFLTVVMGAIFTYYSISDNALNAQAVIPYSSGDIDGNGSVDLSDAVALVRYRYGQYTLSSSAQSAADVYSNDIIDLVDQQVLLLYLAGSISSLPYYQ